MIQRSKGILTFPSKISSPPSFDLINSSYRLKQRRLLKVSSNNRGRKISPEIRGGGGGRGTKDNRPIVRFPSRRDRTAQRKSINACTLPRAQTLFLQPPFLSLLHQGRRKEGRDGIPLALSPGIGTATSDTPIQIIFSSRRSSILEKFPVLIPCHFYRFLS